MASDYRVPRLKNSFHRRPSRSRLTRVGQSNLGIVLLGGIYIRERQSYNITMPTLTPVRISTNCTVVRCTLSNDIPVRVRVQLWRLCCKSEHESAPDVRGNQAFPVSPMVLPGTRLFPRSWRPHSTRRYFLLSSCFNPIRLSECWRNYRNRGVCSGALGNLASDRRTGWTAWPWRGDGKPNSPGLRMRPSSEWAIGRHGLSLFAAIAVCAWWCWLKEIERVLWFWREANRPNSALGNGGFPS